MVYQAKLRGLHQVWATANHDAQYDHHQPLPDVQNTLQPLIRVCESYKALATYELISGTKTECTQLYHAGVAV